MRGPNLFEAIGIQPAPQTIHPPQITVRSLSYFLPAFCIPSLRNKIKFLKQTSMKRIMVAVLAITALATGCKKDQKKNVFKGPEVKVHNGKAWTWVQLKD